MSTSTRTHVTTAAPTTSHPVQAQRPTPYPKAHPALLFVLAALFLTALLIGLPPLHLVLVVVAVDALARGHLQHLGRL